MAERLNPLSMIGASSDPTLGDRLTQSAKATSDLQSGLAKIAQQNRAQLEAQRMAGDTSRATALINKNVMPDSMISTHPKAATAISNLRQSGIDLASAQGLLARYGALEHGANIGLRPQILPEGQQYTFGGTTGAGADATKLSRFTPIPVLKARLSQPKPDVKSKRAISGKVTEVGIGTPGGGDLGGLTKTTRERGTEDSVESKIVNKPLAEELTRQIITDIWENYPEIVRGFNLRGPNNPDGNEVIEAYDLGGGRYRLIVEDPQGNRQQGDIEI
tara:strand:- start:732 stop:1556 length:825 start_codon:yes stop_codon:yes gene_type:complete